VSDGKFDMAEDERVAEAVMGEVNLRKQEEDIAGESAAAAAHMSPLFETRPTGEGTHLNSCMKTLHAPSMQESCAYHAMTTSEKDSGESVDLQSNHTLLGTSPAATRDNEEETTSGN
jgi:hypothetical protein